MKIESNKSLIKKLFTVRILLLLVVFGCAPAAFAAITITPVTWNVIGLDSNKTTDGPNLFPVGARVCNTGAAAVTNVTANFVWDSSNIYINISPTATATITYPSLAAGRCVDYYFDVVITRTSAAYFTTRRFHITAIADAVSQVSTPTPRELYVERLISQNRNTVVSITGPATVYVGQTYNYTVDADTSTNGYEQIETYIDLSNVIFRVLAVSTTYSAPVAGTVTDKVYGDGSTWDTVPTSPTYRSCLGTGKFGGTIRTVYTVQVMSTGATTATTLIRDFSGSSYHYNSDYGTRVLSITALPAPIFVPNVGLTKSVSPSGTSTPGTDLTYTIAFINTGSAAATNFRLTDPNPGSSLQINTNTDFKVGSVVNTLPTGLSGATLSYSNDNGVTYLYTPISGAGGAATGYDRNVTHIRWVFSGSLSQTAPNNSGSISFIVKIR